MADDDSETGAATDGEPAKRVRGQPGKRVRGKPFEPGNRAGIKGRPRADQRLRAALDRWSLEAARCLRDLMRDPKTPRETKRKIAEYIVDRKLGRPTTSIAGVDGQPLLPPGAPADNPLTRLIAAVKARRDAAASAPGASGGPDSTPPENGPPGPSDEGAGLPS